MDEKHLASQLYRNLRTLAVLTVVFLVVLAAAPLKWRDSEWRDLQKEYNRTAKAAGLRPMTVALKLLSFMSVSQRPPPAHLSLTFTFVIGHGAAAPAFAGSWMAKRPWSRVIGSPFFCTLTGGSTVFGLRPTTSYL